MRGFQRGAPVAVKDYRAGAQIFVGGDNFHAAGHLVAGPVPLPFGGHRGVEPVHIHGQTVLPPPDFVHQFRRKSVSIVQSEGHRAGNVSRRARCRQGGIVNARRFQQRRRRPGRRFDIAQNFL